LDALDIEVRFEAIDLAAERVPADSDVHHLDTGAVEAIDFLRKEDGPRAGAPHGPSTLAEVAERLPEIVALDEPGDRRAFAAGDDERVEVWEVLRLADLVGVMPER